MAETQPVDQAHRDRIATDLSATLFVEAGAGTGKTRSLVDRVVSLVRAGVPVERIAAITFTEAAAAELRDRIRGALVDAGLDAAAAGLDAAAISTLHAFAQRILSEHPIEVGLPPAVEVLDEVSSQLAFAERWTAFLDELYDDPDEERTVLRARAAQIRPWTLSVLADIFNDNWDLLADHPPPEVALGAIDVQPVLDAFDRCRELALAHADPEDRLRRSVEEVTPLARRLSRTDDEVEVVELLVQGLKLPRRAGRKDLWDDPDLLQDARSAAAAVGERVAELLAEVRDQVLRRLAARVARFTLDAAAARRADGLLEFHDLLVLARELLRSHPEARRALHRKYERLLIDEFQDTDPIQIELAVLLAAGDDPEGDWQSVDVEPERLFFVGDPKQSIYRFRRADIRLFLEARDRFAGDVAVSLTENFRTVPGVVEWINALFERLMVPGEGQPAHHPLHAFRGDPRDDLIPVTILGGPHDELKAVEIRDAEAAQVASTIVSIVEDGWEVLDADGITRPPRLDEIAILVPSRLCLPALEAELQRAAVPYRTETRSLVWSTQEVRDLLAVLRAVDDPANAVSVVGALRSPAFGCGDDDLLAWHRAGGRWDYRQPPPDGFPTDHPVTAAMAALDDLHARHWWLPVSAVVETAVRERGLFELALAELRPRDVWRRLRWVVDQARAFTETVQGSLREFLEWAELQAADTARVAEPVLPESDDDAVRILTIHGAKGREFPVCILTGMSTEHGRARRGPRVLWPAGGGPPEISLRRDVTTDRFSVEAEAEEQMSSDELIRLLYVGLTRARDHLVVSAHHKRDATCFGSSIWSHLDELEGLWTAGAEADDRALSPRPPEAVVAPADGDFRRRRADALALQHTTETVSATAVASSAADGDVDPELEAIDGERGGGAVRTPVTGTRPAVGGTVLGRAVHAVLQDIDLEGDDLEALAAAAATAEGAPELAGDVVARARAALDSDVVRSATGARHWRELYVAAPIEGRVVEGYVDLLVRTDEGLVVVDYKTDALGDRAAVDAALARYAPQGAAYALALAATTGLPVAGCAFVFLTPDGAVERWVDDLEAVCDRVRAELRAGAVGDGASTG